MRSISLFVVLILPLGCAAEGDARLARHFGAFQGGFILRDLETGEDLRLRPETMFEASSPCSTFKVPHALAALQHGVFTEGSGTVLAWDGRPQWNEDWERDHDLPSAMRHSVVWYFQEIARRLGMARERAWLEKLGYGNADPSSGLETFWLGGGSLLVTPEDQLGFWGRLIRRELPASPSAQEEVLRATLIEEGGRGDRLHGKTGSARGDAEEADLGWFVGGLEGPSGRRVLVCRIRGPGAWGPEARRITLAILAELDLRPDPPTR